MKKSYLFSLIVFSFSLFLISLTLSLFTSCTGSSTSSLAATTTTATTGSRTTSGDTAPPAEVKCDKESDDSTNMCSERDSCADTCKEIYDSARERSECEELSIRQVGELDEVFELLSKDIDDLEKLSDEEDDYKLEHLQCYLSIGGKGWIEAIDSSSFGSNASRKAESAKKTLEWIADNNKVAAMLTGDTNDGVEIVEELLKKMYAAASLNTDDAISQSTPVNANDGTRKGDDETEDLWGLTINSNNGVLKIETFDDGSPDESTITLDSGEDAKLYDALSYLNFDSDNNIFALATDERNPNLFDLAFSLLDEVCNEAKDDEDHERIVCKKALLCWTYQHTTEEVWETIEEIDDINNNTNRQDALGDFGDSSDCKAEEFHDLLN